MSETLAHTATRVLEAASRLTVKSALNPLLWLCGTMTPFLLGAAFMLSRVPTIASLAPVVAIAGLVLPITTLGVGVYFAIAKPEKLQSEDYQIRHQAMTIIQKMGARPQIIDPAAITAIAVPNPAPKALEAGIDK